MVDLKNEALRERHWREILRETNISNNILTLENIFQMNLYQYNDTIQSNENSKQYFVRKFQFRYFTNGD